MKKEPLTAKTKEEIIKTESFYTGKALLTKETEKEYFFFKGAALAVHEIMQKIGQEELTKMCADLIEEKEAKIQRS